MLPRILKSSRVCRRCFCNKAPGLPKDPVYQAFLDKVREYRLKSPTGKPVDPTPEYEQELKEAIEKLALRYGGGEGIDLLAFPKFKMPDFNIDPLSIYDLPEYKDILCDEKEIDPEKEATSKSDVKDKKEEKGKKEDKAKKAKDTKEEKGKNEDKAKKTKDDKKQDPKDEKDKKK